MLNGLVAVGGAHVDRRGRVSGVFIAGASNPGAMREDAGGGGFNALRAARSRGVEATMISVRGGDAAGEFVAAAIAEAGIRDLSATFLDRRTASYTAILDQGGDAVAALADMGIYEECFVRALRRRVARRAIAGAAAVLLDANPPEAALVDAAALALGELHAIAISPAKVVRLRPVASRLSTIFLNRRELAALTDLPHSASPRPVGEALRAAGFRRGVVTDGPRALVAFSPDGVFTIVPPPAPAIADVTGAGDALAGVAIAALMRGAAFAAAVREGIAASLLKLASARAAQSFDETAFAAALARVPAAVAAP